MRAILIINDNSSEAIHAGEFALAVAQKIQVNIMLVNTAEITSKVSIKIPAGHLVKSTPDSYIDFHPASEMFCHLQTLNDRQSNFRPEIEEFDISDMTENEVIEFINKNHIWLMVKGMMDEISSSNKKKSLNAHAVLNKVLCPLLLVPANWEIKNIERMAYMADLRYCRLQIVKYLADVARAWDATLSIAHITAKGLPDMAEKYALIVFSEEVSNNIRYDQLLFNNIKEKDLTKVVDVMINGMRNDILVMVNHRFHFEEIVGRYITDTLPLNITIPLLIFPY